MPTITTVETLTIAFDGRPNRGSLLPGTRTRQII
jgi:hypothetical protein